AAADITLTQTTTGVQRKAQTTASGDFVFNSVAPGVYSVTVEAPGFKKLERTAVNLSANERLSVGVLTMQVGSLAESVTVQAEGTAVQVTSAERSGVITSSQVENLMIKGRNVVTMLQLLPGVVDTNAPDGPDRNFAIGLYVNGDRRNAIGMWLDGVPTQDSGVGWISTLNPSMDALAEVKVLLNQYQAEYGRMRGAGVQMVSKSGTRDFHGSFSYFKRHEQFNANSFFNNRTIVGGKAIPKPRYRYNTFSYTIGGPIYVPGKFNSDKNKLFFFWSQEIWPQRSGIGPTNITVPSDLERAGNFTQSLDVAGKVITVRDPDTQQPFPGNIVPSNRIDASGQSILKFLPLPNFFDRGISGGQYNYVSQVELEKPQRLQTLKTDWNASSKNLVAVTWSRQVDKQTGTMGLATPNANWPLESRTFQTRGNIVSARYQHIFSPSMVNEFVGGYNWRWENETLPEAELARLKRTAVGYKAPQLYPASNPLDLLPNVSFGGIPNTANITLTNIPYEVRYPTVTITDNITKTAGPHILKAGIFMSRQSTNGIASTNRGSISFATNTNNPLETGYTFANALMGVFDNTSQANRYVRGGTVFKAVEWFAQDSWKVSRRFTLEIGMRFVTAPPGYGTTLESAFKLSSWK
ncbi:MAG: carboxypeptidase regulatory-like domain-containing protein, partial [Candidatus Solibacter sp.]|nr:carboxypeptidase regulatory-like domain-containing protein [Candidatus Solibacter sp.]